MTDIQIIELEKQLFKELQESKLVLKFSGKDSTTILTNTLRRLLQLNVPTYAFPEKMIDIEKNSSVFNNDELRANLTSLTVPNLNVPVRHLESVYWKDKSYDSGDRPKHPDDNLDINIYFEEYNNTNDVYNVTTNHAKVYINDEHMENIFDEDYPELIVKLRPGEELTYHMKAILGIGRVNYIWSSVANSYYDISENGIIFTAKSMGQIDEYDALDRACDIMITEINNIKETINLKYGNSDKSMMDVTFDDKDYTIGNIVNDKLQNMILNKKNKILFSGISRPDHLRKDVIIKIKMEDNNPVIPLLNKAFDETIVTFNHVKNLLIKLAKKH